ncbi:MAG: HAMP domain-containing histidine kinase [Chloroflexota bacterium]|nr:HAMP domain-containing histidine kinase [Chloroflexota bacterium]
MSFRLRLTALAAAAVALAVVGAGTLMYAQMERELFSELDRSLNADAAVARGPEPARVGDRFPFRAIGPAALALRPDVHAQVIDSSGRVLRADTRPVPALVTAEARAVAHDGNRTAFSTVKLEDTRVRVLAVPFGPNQALLITRSMDEIDRVLADTRTTLLIVALGGILLAAALGALVARTALAPVARLSATVEDVARTRDMSRRVAVTSRDELGRLGASFDAMLAALESSLRAQRQLVADASHELRTPLTSLRTNLELLARGQPTDELERQQMLRDLVSQMERLSTLVSDLIDLARDEETALPVEDVRLDSVVVDAIEDISQRYDSVRFTLQSMPSTVRGVRSRVARAVTNLLDNAAKWSPRDGVIEVTVGESEVVVRDHGPGIAAGDASRVFDRFWRAANARHLPGSGLGLAIVRDVAEAHGGSVVLERPADGGARFRLRLGSAASS